MSPEFEKMLHWGGSPQAMCACGRVHFTASGDFMEPGELDGLIAKAKAEPDHYIADNENDSVSIAEFNGVVAVWGCPCDHFNRADSFLWRNRNNFLDYYRARIEREKKEADETAAKMP